MAIHFDTRQFLKTLAGVAQGQLQGQMQGRQEYHADQLQQQQLAQQQQEFALHQQQVQNQLDSEAQARRLEPYKVLAPFANRFTPGGLSSYLGDLSAAATPQPAASALAAVPGHRPLMPPGPTAPAQPQQPDWYQQVQAQTTSPTPPMQPAGFEASAQGMIPMGVTQGTTPPPAQTPAPNPLSVKGPAGKTYEIAGVTDKDRAFLNQRYQKAIGLSRQVPPNSPAAAIIAQNQPNVNLDPQTPEELASSQKALMAIEGAMNGIGLNTASAAAGDRKNIDKEIDDLKGVKGPQLASSLANVWRQAKEAESNYGKGGFGFRLQGWKKELDELEGLSQSNDPADQQKAEQLAQTIAGGISSNLKPEQVTARVNAWLKLISKKSYRDKDYNKFSHDKAVSLGIESELGDTNGLAGAALEKAYQSSLHAMVGFSGLDARGQRPLLQDLQRLAQATGRDPNTIPNELARVVTEKDRIAIERGRQGLDYADKAEARAEKRFEMDQQKFTEQQRKLTNGGQLNAAQTLKGYSDQYKNARKALDDYLKSNYGATRDDIDSGDMLDPAQKAKAKALRDTETRAFNAANTFFDKAKSNGKPTSTTTTTTTRAAAQGPSVEYRAAFNRIKRDHPNAKPAEIDTFLHGKGLQ